MSSASSPPVLTGSSANTGGATAAVEPTPHAENDAPRAPRGGGVARLPGIVRPLLVLAAPVLIEQTLALGVGMTDKWLSGNLLPGPEYLAAVGLVAYCWGFLPVLFAVASVSVTAIVARAVGAGDLPTASRVTAQAMLVGAGVVVAVLVVAAFGGRAFISMLGLPDASSQLAGDYLAIVLPALPAVMFTQVGVAALRGAGEMTTGMVVMTVVNVVNAVASAALATGWGGLPELGWRGLAWGTFLGAGCGAAFTAGVLFRGRSPLHLSASCWVPDAALVKRLTRVGMPAGWDGIAQAVCQLAFLSIVNRLGDVDAAAHSLAITIESLAFLPGSAFQVSAATLSGQFLGARDERRARDSVWLAAIVCTLLMSSVAVLLGIEADRLAAFFLADGQQEVASITAGLVRIVAFAQPPLAALMVFSGGLRGAGQTRAPMIVNLAVLVFVRLPLALFLAWDTIPVPGGLGSLPGLGLGVTGAWYAMAIDLLLRGSVLTALFCAPGWSKIRV
ncbi:MAG: MATE family efflux transporter [Pirellulales bacterium]|jgi:putative MATE family efflux protein